MKSKRAALIQFLSCSILLAVVYLPTFKWMYVRWTAPESYYGHGFLIPLVSLYLAWQKRGKIRAAAPSNNATGLLIIAAGISLHLISAALRVYFISGFTFVFVLYGLILFFFGTKIARLLAFPALFLFAMVPLPLVLIGNLVVKLKLFVAHVSTIILNKIGFPSIRDGSIIKMPNSYILVEAPCSGLRSLIALLTLGLLFAFAMKVSYLKRGVLFVSSIPIALASNVVRIMMLAIVNDLYGEKVAMGFFHDFSGFFMFGFAFVALYWISKTLEPRRAYEDE